MNPAHHLRGITKPPETERCPIIPILPRDDKIIPK